MEASETPARVQQVVGEVMQKYEHQINGKLQRANDVAANRRARAGS